ncbi:MAG: HAMP domain-containing histidine kinase [Pseudomonadota bacterium]|nr:HAMP domain-containing histidine kinase [Pseudomonadota bacterium]
MTNRTVLIDRCLAMVGTRSNPKVTDEEVSHGIPMFLDQLIETLALEQTSALQDHAVDGSNGRGTFSSELGATATLHGGDLFRGGFTLEQVVRDYGDVCQAVTNLAFETDASISVDEFRTFNRCLDNAIAGAVTEFARHTSASDDDGLKSFNARLGPLAHELRNCLQTATFAAKAIRAGTSGVGGATASVLDRSLMAMSNLIDRALAEVRVTAGLPPRLQPIHLAKFLGEVEASASLDARARGSRFRVAPVVEDIQIFADPEMLAATVGNLLHNAFKFTIRHTEVWLRGQASKNQVLIEVEDHCGGLPEGACEKLMLPFVQVGSDRSGLGLGLDICRRSLEAMNGQLKIRDLPGSGCIFTICLPRYMGT